ncbi:MAG TPA: hypothetical protein VHV10_06930 [Ktedonobacteraceae bacterium]|jgi:hypothetical protein|nr:hypothetical protein [Ktedonobacteraceae bacterium]
MITLYIQPTDEIQAIQDAIQATVPDQTIIFEPGVYMLDRTLQLVEGRSYIANNAAFRLTPEMQSSAIKVVERPDSEKSWLEKKLSNRPFLMKIAVWVCRLLHIPFAPGTLITGFYIHGNGQGAAIQMRQNPSS